MTFMQSGVSPDITEPAWHGMFDGLGRILLKPHTLKLRDVHFDSVEACVAEMAMLRGGYRAGGSWSLAQAC
jgi:hypothetical protein